ncbi:hypothetical protein POTOM_002693 [Populus tomentosa]|uniref:Uncharacterized protein n=1 Tax=Populus tomentosa TaxID=118781 RepID=A0A8X8DK56_POPTO|nr:hypothetical protein POTOM_002693 [Populus tomentosa]
MHSHVGGFKELSFCSDLHPSYVIIASSSFLKLKILVVLVFLVSRPRYLLVAMMHIPSYGLFMLFIKIKHNLLTKWFPQSYSC